LILALAAAVPTVAHGQSRSGWQIHLGEGLVRFSTPSARHGDPAEFEAARIPGPTEPGWLPAPDANTIGFDQRSTVCDAPFLCGEGGDFTYFRTELCVPDPRRLRSLAVRVTEVDDGARITLFNASHPMGVVPDNAFGFIFADPFTTGDLTSFLRAGEPTTIVITHVDDCCMLARLRGVEVLVDGRPLPPSRGVEVCNGLDDDCNGLIDDRLGAITCGTGVCTRTVLACMGGVPQTCVPGTASPEVCNGLDDDCNGVIDDAPECMEPSPEPIPEPPPDAALDAPPDEPAPWCNSTRCDPDLRLGGRAGPLGGCTCTVLPHARPTDTSLAMCSFGLWVLLRGRRRRASRAHER
jgi:hypothetical protein